MKFNITKLLLFSSFPFFLYSCSCSGDSKKEKDKENTEAVADEEDEDSEEEAEASEDSEASKPSDPRSRKYYSGAVNKENTFIVISKKNLNLSVYAGVGGDTVLVARYPVCLSKNKGQKEGSGDMRTPESEPNEPFTITEIKDASTWCHDFGDGRGQILAYGAWFLRLSYGSGIGIHGSTNNRWSIPGSGEAVPQGKTLGRDSEGCIRLLDEDIIHLHNNYAFVGQKVIIKKETQDALPFEKRIKNKNEEGKLLR